MKQGLEFYATLSQTPTAASTKFQSIALPPRADGSQSTMGKSRKGLGLRQEFGEYNSTNSLTRGARNEIDETASLFNYMPRGSSPAKSNKSILYKMHKQPRKTLNIVDGSSKYGRAQDVQRFNEDFDHQSVKSLVSLSSKLKPPMTGLKQRMATSQSRIGKTIDYDIGESASQVGGAFDRQSNSAHRRNDSANGLKEATLRKIANNSRLNRGSLIESIKNMNED